MGSASFGPFITVADGLWRRQHGVNAIAISDPAAYWIERLGLFRFRFGKLVFGIIFGRFVERVGLKLASTRTCACAIGAAGSSRERDDPVGGADLAGLAMVYGEAERP
jgi:hypothetical protein